MTSLLISTSILNSMFFLSGVDKIAHFEKAAMGLSMRLGNTTPALITRLMILAAILIEILAPATIFYTSLNRSLTNDKLATYAAGSLIVFTILATLIYHFPPWKSVKYYPFISNLSALGGLVLMFLLFQKNLVL
jgi:hypothetical protein